MTPELTQPPPGSMTVPPLFGWQEIATVLVLLVALGIAFLVVAATRADAGERSEWQAYLEGRSGRLHDPAAAPQHEADRAVPVRSARPRHGAADGGVRSG